MKTGSIAGVVHNKPISNEQMRKLTVRQRRAQTSREQKSGAAKENDLLLLLSLF